MLYLPDYQQYNFVWQTIDYDQFKQQLKTFLITGHYDYLFVLGISLLNPNVSVALAQLHTLPIPDVSAPMMCRIFF